MVELMFFFQFLIRDSTQHFIMRKSLEIMMVFGLIFIVISSPIPLPSDIDEEGNGTSELDENTSLLKFQFAEESIQGGNINEPSTVEIMNNVPNMADVFSQIYSEIQYDAAYNYQRDQLTFIQL